MAKKPQTKQITIREYVEKVSPERFRKNRKHPEKPLTQQAIKHRIKKGILLPEVIAYTKVSHLHILTVDIDF
jgi:hypothetical protein